MRNIHLLVLIHGMWGNPEHLAEMNRIIQETKGSASSASGNSEGSDAELEVLVAQTNRDEGTYDGIDWGGERVADEVCHFIIGFSSFLSILTVVFDGYPLSRCTRRFNSLKPTEMWSQDSRSRATVSVACYLAM